jgi:uncharacterized damage-inducible protein DinB
MTGKRTGRTGGDERGALVHFLTAQRRSAIAVVEGMTEADARRSVVPSGWTPLTLTMHLADVERHWFAFAVGGDRSHTPAQPVTPHTLNDAILAYRAEIDRSDRLLAEADLDAAPAEIPDEMPGEIHTVRDVVLHVIEEIARHAGHLDIARELLDGTTGHGPR